MIRAIDEVPVPLGLEEWAFEYRLGFYNGLRGSKEHCPIDNTMLYPAVRRQAWIAGRKDGGTERLRRQAVRKAEQMQGDKLA